MYGLLRDRLDVEHGDEQFKLPPDAHLLRAELAVLPLTLDSECRYVLPPKRRSAARPGELSIEKLLGRSRDRANSLALAVFVLDRYRGYPDDDVDFSGYDEDLRDEDWDTMPDEFIELFRSYDEREREWKAARRFGDDWDR